MRERLFTGKGHIDKGGDHPRLCGNDGNSDTANADEEGSPPLVRERLASQYFVKLNLGITPACAGTTALDDVDRLYCQDHPRLCGNDATPSTISNLLKGSPPLVRERPCAPLLNACRLRITPACAGTTHSRLLTRLLLLGSPPLVRERPISPVALAPSMRITPACAGTTIADIAIFQGVGDHPRLCGNDLAMRMS